MTTRVTITNNSERDCVLVTALDHRDMPASIPQPLMAGESCVFWVHASQSLLVGELPADGQLEVTQRNPATDGTAARPVELTQTFEIYP